LRFAVRCPDKVYAFLRKWFCCLIALVIIVTGRIRRARRRAHSGEVITPIYFHNPGKELFERCLAWLTHHGYTFITEAELVTILRGHRKFPRGAVWLSFDDGYKEWTDNVVPILRRYEAPATFFIPTGIISGNRKFPWLHERDEAEGQVGDAPHPDGDSLGVNELLQAAQFPEITLGGHTVNHSITTRCSHAQLGIEIGGCKTSLQKWAPKAVASFAYPEGRFDGREREHLMEAGYSIAATTEPGFIDGETDSFLIPRFCVADNVSMPEAICNMVGEWQPVIRRLKRVLRVGGEKQVSCPIA
jgi:peptidoglycan/xylan/chitin deacetylase (PgdA/CDA1 family)